MQLKIGGQLVDVNIGDKCMGNMGYARVSHNEIAISTDQAQEQQESTLLHEIIEFINSEHELGLNHSTICTLEVALFQVLKENYFITFIKPDKDEVPF